MRQQGQLDHPKLREAAHLATVAIGRLTEQMRVLDDISPLARGGITVRIDHVLGGKTMVARAELRATVRLMSAAYEMDAETAGPFVTGDDEWGSR